MVYAFKSTVCLQRSAAALHRVGSTKHTNKANTQQAIIIIIIDRYHIDRHDATQPHPVRMYAPIPCYFTAYYPAHTLKFFPFFVSFLFFLFVRFAHTNTHTHTRDAALALVRDDDAALVLFVVSDDALLALVLFVIFVRDDDDDADAVSVAVLALVLFVILVRDDDADAALVLFVRLMYS